MESQKSEVPEFAVKITLLGDGAVGKSSLRRQYMGKGFTKSHLMTLGADFAQKRVKLDNDKNVTLHIWDIAGQESFEKIRKRFLMNSQGALIVFDLTRHDTFMNIPRWFKELWEINPGKRIPTLIVGNKMDLSDQIKVDENEIQLLINTLTTKYRERLPSVKYIKTSAKTGENVDKGFNTLASAIIGIIT